jgi:DDE superfamily endonuclease
MLVTIDGVDFQIPEPTPFDSKWFSHKFGGPGLRYEIGVCIKTGKIVSFNGPFECGTWPDLKIFRSRLRGMLSVGEKVISDRGYRGDARIITPDRAESANHCRAMNKACARHEQTINGRLKTWGILKQVFAMSETNITSHSDTYSFSPKLLLRMALYHSRLVI